MFSSKNGIKLITSGIESIVFTGLYRKDTCNCNASGPRRLGLLLLIIIVNFKLELKDSTLSKTEVPVQNEPPRINRREANDVLMLNELLPITAYEPDFDAAKFGGARLYIGCGRYGLKRKAWYAKVAQILAKKLSCELVEFPGHHGSYMDNPVEWAKVIRETADKAGW